MLKITGESLQHVRAGVDSPVFQGPGWSLNTPQMINSDAFKERLLYQ